MRSGEGDELDFTGFRPFAMSGSETMRRMRSKFPSHDLVVGAVVGSDAATANFNWTKVCVSYVVACELLLSSLNATRYIVMCTVAALGVYHLHALVEAYYGRH